MKLEYIEVIAVHPGPSSTPSGPGPYTLQFDPSSIPSKFDDLVPHVMRTRLEMSGVVVSANGAPGIDRNEWALMLSRFNGAGNGFAEGVGVDYTGQGAHPIQCSYLSARRIMESVHEMNGSYGPLHSVGTAVPANTSGSEARTPVVVDFVLDFYSERWQNPYQWILPLQWWSTGAWSYYLSALSSVFASSLSWAATPTFRLVVEIMLSPHIIMAAPFEWRERGNVTPTTANTQIQPGIYQTGGFMSPAFGGAAGFGCDNLLAKVQTISNSEWPNRYPLEATPRDYGMRQNMQGAFVGLSPFAMNTSLPTPTLATISLFGPKYIGPREESFSNEYRQDKNINWNVSLLSNLSNQHLFYFGKSLSRVSCDSNNLGGQVGSVVADAIGKSLGGCGGFGGFTPLIPDGMSSPSAVNLGRTTIIAMRRGR